MEEEDVGNCLCSHRYIPKMKKTIHYTNNMRMCDDYYIATSIVSNIEKCDFVVICLNCLHDFEDGN